MSCPAKLGLEEYCSNARYFGCTRNLKTGDLDLPADAKDGTKSTHMKLVQLLNEPVVHLPGLAPLEKRCKDTGTVDLEHCEESDVVLAERPSAEPSDCLVCSADPRRDLSIKRSIAGDAAAQVFEVARVLQLGTLNKNGWFRSVSVRCSLMKVFSLAKADELPKQF